MDLADKSKVDDFIKEYIIINSRIKIAKAKIRHAEYQNNKLTVLKNKKILYELESIKSIVDNNISNEHLSKLEIFRINVKDAIELFKINRNNLFKLKRDIREEFKQVIEIIEAE